MAIYHNSCQIISRNDGRSAVAAAAYRSGQDLEDEQTHEIKRQHKNKDKVVYSEIFLPENAPECLRDRQTLWNEVERVEKAKDAQLAREFNIALMRELSLEENISLARRFAAYLCDKGMIVDVNYHDSKDNPHIHIMCPMRSIDSKGKWRNKSKKVYDIDEEITREDQRIPIIDEEKLAAYEEEHGPLDIKTCSDIELAQVQKRDKDNRRQWKNHKETLTEWDSPEELQEWREKWAEFANEALEKAGFEERISAKSYEEQGLEQIPTIHEGYEARQLGEQSEKVQRNNEIREANHEISKLQAEREIWRDRQLAALEEQKDILTGKDPESLDQKLDEAKEQRSYWVLMREKIEQKLRDRRRPAAERHDYIRERKFHPIRIRQPQIPKEVQNMNEAENMELAERYARQAYNIMREMTRIMNEINQKMSRAKERFQELMETGEASQELVAEMQHHEAQIEKFDNYLERAEVRAQERNEQQIVRPEQPEEPVRAHKHSELKSEKTVAHEREREARTEDYAERQQQRAREPQFKPNQRNQRVHDRTRITPEGKIDAASISLGDLDDIVTIPFSLNPHSRYTLPDYRNALQEERGERESQLYHDKEVLHDLAREYVKQHPVADPQEYKNEFWDIDNGHNFAKFEEVYGDKYDFSALADRIKKNEKRIKELWAEDDRARKEFNHYKYHVPAPENSREIAAKDEAKFNRALSRVFDEHKNLKKEQSVEDLGQAIMQEAERVRTPEREAVKEAVKEVAKEEKLPTLDEINAERQRLMREHNEIYMGFNGHKKSAKDPERLKEINDRLKELQKIERIIDPRVRVRVQELDLER